MNIRVGIARSLLYYKYFPFWKEYLESFGLEVILSNQTNKEILLNGIINSIDESCLPVKVFVGHVIDLVDKVDYLFIPRIKSIKKKEFLCPKFLGLPDIARNCVENCPPIFTPNIDANEISFYSSMYKFGKKFTRNPLTLYRNYKKALIKQKKTKESLSKLTTPLEMNSVLEDKVENKTEYNNVGYTVSLNNNNNNNVIVSNNLKIAFIGHAYNIYDNFINQNLIKKLNNMGVDVVTQEMIPHHELEKESFYISDNIYWTYNREIVAATKWWVKNKIDGVIFIISFPCGPDSLVIEYLCRDIKKYNIPVMNLILDEHQSEVGLITRLESFVDIIKIKKRR